MEFPDDVDELHWLLMEVIDVLEANAHADASRLAMIVYATTPCENCRASAVRLLHNQQAAPRWLTAECRFDCSETCRQLADPIA